MSKKESNKAYLERKLKPFLDVFVIDLLLEKPEDIVIITFFHRSQIYGKWLSVLIKKNLGGVSAELDKTKRRYNVLYSSFFQREKQYI